METQLLWKPQQVNNILAIRTAAKPESLSWYPTAYPGISFGCFESDSTVQDHPVTMLTRFAPRGYFPLHGHPGGEEILVLDGQFADETGIHPPGTYMLNPEGFVHRPYSEAGCLTFVKLRQHGGKHRHQLKINIFAEDWQPGIIPKIQVLPVYEQPGFSEKVWFERWQAGTQLSQVTSPKVTEIFVVEGSWSDEFGQYPTHSWLRYPPYQPYSPASETGCLVYVKTYPIVDSALRFIVDEQFQHPEETVIWDQRVATAS